MRELRSLVVIGLSSIVTTIAASGTAHAQAANYDVFRVDSGLTGSHTGATGRNGAGAVFELKFMVHDNVAVGARFGAEAMWGGSVGNDNVEMEMAAAVASLAKGEYLIGHGPVRPFVGLGLGVYTIAAQKIAAGPGTAGIDQQGGRYFGVAPQLGIDLGRLRLAATYNMIMGADIEVRQTVGNIEQSASISQNYLSFDMSIRFGGGRKHRPLPVMIPAPPPPAPVVAPPPVAPPPAPPAPAPAPNGLPGDL